ncbi:MAG: TrkA C-terminal domain-containing protein [Pseudomonadota bacterium]
MQIDLYEVFSRDTTLVVFAAISIGFLIGKLRIGGFQLGVTGGVLISALAFGHFGFTVDPVVQTIGFTLFIYCVGLQAGPQFFAVLQQDGSRYVSITLFVALGSLGLVLALSAFAGFDAGLSAGLMAGALTSTPTLVGAENAVTAGLFTPPQDMVAGDVLQMIGVGYAITYLFGTIGLLLLVKLLPVVLRLDLPAAASALAHERGMDAGTHRPTAQQPLLRAYLVENQAYEGRTLAQILAEIRKRGLEEGVLYRIKRDDALIEPHPDLALQLGDKIAFFATAKGYALAPEDMAVGRQVFDDDLVDAAVDVAEIVVTNANMVGRSLGDLDIRAAYGCFLSEVRRSQIALPLDPSTRLQKGDVVTASGGRQLLNRLAADLGSEERTIQETDLVTFAAGIVGGLLLGQIQVTIGAIDIGLGSAGGLLLAGILIGFLRSNHPTFGRVPPAARFILMELGLMLFMVGVGLRAGGGIVDALLSVGPVLLLCGVVVTMTPLICGYAFGRLVLKMNPALLLGALTGAMTSTPALSIVQAAAQSPVPALGYAGTYALANVLLTIAGTMIMVL